MNDTDRDTVTGDDGSTNDYVCFDCGSDPLNERQAAEHSREYRHCVTDTSSPASAPCNGFCRRADH